MHDATSPAHLPTGEDFYAESMRVLLEEGIPFVVGGAYALRHHTGVVRDTKDLDVFVKYDDVDRAIRAFHGRGFPARIVFPHWLAKAFSAEWFVDLIYNSANGCTPVDDGWFENASHGEVLGVKAPVQGPEEMIWSKAFVMERERFDGADIAHVILACGRDMDWERLLAIFGPRWRVLFAHVVLFGFAYPEERACVPQWVTEELLARLRDDREPDPHEKGVCLGTLLSREQYLVDLERGYRDGRLAPTGGVSEEAIAIWTAAIQR